MADPLSDPGLEIPYDAPDSVRAGLRRLGRVEDLKFSPDNSRLVVVGYDRSSIAIVDVDIAVTGDHPEVALTDMVELPSAHLNQPHGVDFLDDDTIVVANRLGTVNCFRLPRRGTAASGADLEPIDCGPQQEFHGLREPGSVAVRVDADGGREVLVCNNGGNTVTSHSLEPASLGVSASNVLLRRWLGTPDGIAISPDDRWMAVSNHQARTVMLYDRSRALDEDSDPDGILRGALAPHGVCFSADGGHLFVADAAQPFLHVYARVGRTWGGVQQPAASLHVIDEETFRIGLRIGPEHGGPKGVDIDRHGHVLAMSAVAQPLAFFDVCAILERMADHRPDPALLVQYELGLEQERHLGRSARLRVATLTGSYSFRLTRPLRYFKRTWSRRRRA
jgi:sugar lactone lactonase YvrE